MGVACTPQPRCDFNYFMLIFYFGWSIGFYNVFFAKSAKRFLPGSLLHSGTDNEQRPVRAAESRREEETGSPSQKENKSTGARAAA